LITFLVRRLIGAVLVLIAVSFITYLIFVKIPGGDPAVRIEPAERRRADQERYSRDLLALYRRRDHLAELRHPGRRHLGRHRGTVV
jgi:ABC-type dipeptide/oligopeptide/nickel transport system permease component